MLEFNSNFKPSSLSHSLIAKQQLLKKSILRIFFSMIWKRFASFQYFFSMLSWKVHWQLRFWNYVDEFWYSISWFNKSQSVKEIFSSNQLVFFLQQSFQIHCKGPFHSVWWMISLWINFLFYSFLCRSFFFKKEWLILQKSSDPIFKPHCHLMSCFVLASHNSFYYMSLSVILKNVCLLPIEKIKFISRNLYALNVDFFKKRFVGSELKI